jgi:transcriptional regulator with XRE-family HTH domain
MTTHLRQVRKEQGLTQRQVAMRAGLDIQRVSLAERSLDPRRISVGTAIPLARALGIEPSEILNDKSLTI